jgi:threonine dehydratase
MHINESGWEKVMESEKKAPVLSDIQEAAKRIAPYAHETPVFTSKILNEMSGAELYFKAENLQRVGAFKFRGATNAVFSLADSDAQRGVLTHSSGNHGGALALAAQLRGIGATIIVPRNAPPVKMAAIRSYGARIIECDPTLKARHETAAAVLAESGATFIHPYDDPVIIAGAGTAALELLTRYPDLDLVMTPVGGGGLLSGTAIATTSISEKAKVIAAEPAGADDAYRSFKSGKLVPQLAPQTIADGLLTSLSPLTFRVIQAHVSDIVTVEEAEIIAAMKLVWERMKLVIEPSSAVPIAALLNHKVQSEGKKVGVIISGGNVDLNRLPWQSQP